MKICIDCGYWSHESGVCHYDQKALVELVEVEVTHRKPGVTVTTAAGIEVSWIPAGSFSMGSPPDESERHASEGPQRLVTFAKGFWMGRYEITLGQYEAVMGERLRGMPDLGKENPAVNVCWSDAKRFLSALNGNSDDFIYSLPTEAEWEYAARAGSTTAFSFGDSLSSIQANFNGNFPYGCESKGPHFGATIKVGSYLPNSWGLYDMHGNIWEWVEDEYRECYEQLGTSGEAYVETDKKYGTGILRGGSWRWPAFGVRSAIRKPASKLDGGATEHGFRVVARNRQLFS